MTATTVSEDFDKPLTEEAAQSYTMPARYYLDPGVYELEKQVIFERTWHYIGHESQVRDSGD